MLHGLYSANVHFDDVNRRIDGINQRVERLEDLRARVSDRVTARPEATGCNGPSRLPCMGWQSVWLTPGSRRCRIGSTVYELPCSSICCGANRTLPAGMLIGSILIHAGDRPTRTGIQGASQSTVNDPDRLEQPEAMVDQNVHPARLDPALRWKAPALVPSELRSRSGSSPWSCGFAPRDLAKDRGFQCRGTLSARLCLAAFNPSCVPQRSWPNTLAGNPVPGIVSGSGPPSCLLFTS